MIKDIGHEKATYDNELDFWCKNVLGTDFYKGIYSSDNYPKLHKNTAIIVNEDDSNGPGIHWVALYKGKNNKTYMYDSFGRDKSKVLKSYKGGLKYPQRDKEQQEWQDNCGQLTVSWMYLAKNYPYDDVAKYI